MFSDLPGSTTLASHSIEVTCKTPIWSPSYPIPIKVEEQFRQELNNLLELGIIKPSLCKWSSPPIPIKKKDGGLPIVVDVCKINEVTVPEPFFMPTVDSIKSRVGDSKFLSKLDLLKGIHQVPLEESSKKYTAFSWPCGKFQYQRKPFGLKNAPATFQLLMQCVLKGLEAYALGYLDDVVVIFSVLFRSLAAR